MSQEVLDFIDHHGMKVIECEEEKPPPQSMNMIDFIEHFGVRGMKWGVRNPKNRVKVSSDFKKTAPLRNRKTRELTNKQLQSVNSRIKLEQTYKRSHPSKIAKGQAVVGVLLGLAGTATAIHNLQHNPAVKALVSAGRSHIAKLSAKTMKVPFEQLKLF